MNAVDLFSGPGGLTLGLKKAGIKPISAVEFNKDAFATYSLHTKPNEHYCDDIQNVSFNHLKGMVDLVYGGPPCQPFSLGGLRKGKFDSRDMIPAFIRALKETCTPNFIMENVPGLEMKYAKSYLDGAIREFSLLGYNVCYGVVNAADYGVPQNRKRLIVFGSKYFNPKFPVPTHGPSRSHPYVTVRDALGNEPIGMPSPSPVKYAKNPDLRSSPFAGHIYNGGGRPINLDAPSPTILASFGGHKTHWIDTNNTAIEYHKHLMNGGKPWDGEVIGARRLSPEESAILQSFPREMVFIGTRSSQYTQIGDAVPPLLAEVLGKSFVTQLNGRSKSSDLIDAAHHCKQMEMF